MIEWRKYVMKTLDDGDMISKEEFWKALSEPVEKNCDNCKYWINNCSLRVGADCAEALSTVSKRIRSHWEWDGKTY